MYMVFYHKIYFYYVNYIKVESKLPHYKILYAIMQHYAFLHSIDLTVYL